MFSTEDQVIRGETLQVLDCVQCSYSFVSTNNDKKKIQIYFLIQRLLYLTNRERQKLNVLSSSEWLRLLRNSWLKTLNCNHLALSLMKRQQVKWKKKTVWRLFPVLIQSKKGNYQQAVIPVPNPKWLIIP